MIKKCNGKFTFVPAEGATHVGNCHSSRRTAFTLAEGATHVGISHNNRRVAFTLAEVLITLGIIGIVSAMTIPTLVKNYQKKVFANQIKKSYSLLSQGFKRMMVDDMADYFGQTSLILDLKKLGEQCIGAHETEDIQPACKIFTTYMGKYFKVASIEVKTDYKYKVRSSISSYTGQIIKLADGSFIFEYNFSPDPTAGNTLSIDINGAKGPNELGRDVFTDLMIANNSNRGFQFIMDDLSRDELREMCVVYAIYEDCVGAYLKANNWVMDY